MRPPDTSIRSRLALPLTAAAGLLLLLCACGQSGDLYLPDKKAPATAAPAPAVVPATGVPAPEAQPTSEEEKKKKESEEAQRPASPPPPATTSPSTTPTSP